MTDLFTRLRRAAVCVVGLAFVSGGLDAMAQIISGSVLVGQPSHAAGTNSAPMIVGPEIMIVGAGESCRYAVLDKAGNIVACLNDPAPAPVIAMGAGSENVTWCRDDPSKLCVAGMALGGGLLKIAVPDDREHLAYACGWLAAIWEARVIKETARADDKGKCVEYDAKWGAK